MKTIIEIKGLHCASCKALIEDVAKDVKGVVACEVDFEAGTASIEHTDEFKVSEFAAEVAKLGDGYKVLNV